MFNYFRFEFKNTLKPFLCFTLSAAVLTSLVQVFASSVAIGNVTAIKGIIFAIVALSAVATALVFFFYMVSIYSSDLYDTRGYMTFMIPISGYKIVTAKLLISYFWSFVSSVVVSITNLLVAFVIYNDMPGIVEVIKEIVKIIPHTYGFLFSIFMEVSIIGLIILGILYFALTISKITVKTKRLSLWFCAGLFIVMLVLYTYFFPNHLLTGIKDTVFIPSQLRLTNSYEIFNLSGEPDLPFFISFNFLASLAILIGLIAGIGHLLDKRVNL